MISTIFNFIFIVFSKQKVWKLIFLRECRVFPSLDLFSNGLNFARAEVFAIAYQLTWLWFVCSLCRGYWLFWKLYPRCRSDGHSSCDWRRCPADGNLGRDGHGLKWRIKQTCSQINHGVSSGLTREFRISNGKQFKQWECRIMIFPHSAGKAS